MQTTDVQFSERNIFDKQGSSLALKKYYTYIKIKTFVSYCNSCMACG